MAPFARAVVAGGLLAAALTGARLVDGPAAAQAPGDPTGLLAAAVLDSGDVGLDGQRPAMAERATVFVLELAAPPACAGGDVYGFLLDADRDPATTAGPAEAAWDDLGPDAAVLGVCDPSTGELRQPAGYDLAVAPAETRTAVTITVPNVLMSSLDFDWLAFAQRGQALDRVPGHGAHGRYRPAEQALP